MINSSARRKRPNRLRAEAIPVISSPLDPRAQSAKSPVEPRGELRASLPHSPNQSPSNRTSTSRRFRVRTRDAPRARAGRRVAALAKQGNPAARETGKSLAGRRQGFSKFSHWRLTGQIHKLNGAVEARPEKRAQNFGAARITKRSNGYEEQAEIRNISAVCQIRF